MLLLLASYGAFIARRPRADKPKRRFDEGTWNQYLERKETVLSEELAKKLNAVLVEKEQMRRLELTRKEEEARRLNAILAENNAIRQINETLVKRNIQTEGILLEIKNPPKPEIDPQKKAELMRRLELARQAKEAKKKAEEARRKQMLKNLSKGWKRKK